MPSRGAGRVYVLGDSRTGTLSLHIYFVQNGLRSIHHYEEQADQLRPHDLHKEANAATFFRFISGTGAQAFSDYPTRRFFRQLYDLQPEAKFILSVRASTEIWKASMSKTMPVFGWNDLDVEAGAVRYEQDNSEIEALYSKDRAFLKLVIDDDPQANQRKLDEFMGWPNAVPLTHAHASAAKRFELPASQLPSVKILEPVVPFPGAHPAVKATRSMLDDEITGISSQFRENAHTYDERYFNDTRRSMVENALAAVGLGVPGDGRPLSVLDIGCGSGNASFAILKMFGNAQIWATDMSPELLSILAVRAEKAGLLAHFKLFVSDASAIRLAPAAFDIVIGSSMVHHLVDAEGFMTRMLDSVAPGGTAMFFEPFQAGHVVVRQLLSTLVRLSEVYEGLSPERVAFFKAYIFTISTMLREDRDDPIFLGIDDKWMFTRGIFNRVADRTGCRIELFTTNPLQGAFLNKVTELLWHGLGDQQPLPAWALEVIEEADLNVGAELRQELLMEGCIVFRK